MVNRNIIYENLNKVKMYLDNEVQINDNNSHRYSVAKCLKCGLCLNVCPNYSYGSNFLVLFLRMIHICYIVLKEKIKRILWSHIKKLYSTLF